MKITTKSVPLSDFKELVKSFNDFAKGVGEALGVIAKKVNKSTDTQETSETEKKLTYYQGQYERFLDRYIDSNSRKDRDVVVRTKERIKTYKEAFIKNQPTNSKYDILDD